MTTPTCIDCGKILYGNKTLCRKCKRQRFPREYIRCIDCGKPLTNYGMRCRECYYKDKERIDNELADNFDKGLALCRTCQSFLPVDKFNKGPKQNFYLRYHCRDCEKTKYQKRKQYHQEYFKKRNNRLKRKYVKLMGGKCQNCGYDKYMSALQFHHVDPNDKETELTKILYNENCTDQIMLELDKCCLLCANCHSAIKPGELELKFIKNGALGWTIK